MKPPMKPGWKTSEMWLTALTHAIALFLVSDALPETHWLVKAASLIGAALAQHGYTAGRAKLKAGGGGQ